MPSMSKAGMVVLAFFLAAVFRSELSGFVAANRDAHISATHAVIIYSEPDTSEVYLINANPTEPVHCSVSRRAEGSVCTPVEATAEIPSLVNLLFPSNDLRRCEEAIASTYLMIDGVRRSVTAFHSSQTTRGVMCHYRVVYPQ